MRLKEKKRLLFLAPRFPYPASSGGKLFLLNVAKALQGHHLTLLSLCGSRAEMEYEPKDDIFTEVHRVYLPKWESYLSTFLALPTSRPLQLAYYGSSRFEDKVRELMPRHDAAFAHLIRTGQFIRADVPGGIPRVLLMADAISLAYERMSELSDAPWIWRLIYRAELKRLFRTERAYPKSFDQTWLHSEIDRSFLKLNSGSVKIVPVGIDLDEFPFDAKRSGNTVAFVGNMSFSLNQDACLYFIREIFPLIREKKPLRFRIIGACPQTLQKQLRRHEGVEVTGYVHRIADAVEDVFCGISPVRAGAGIQNKILNYLALGIPCVTSEVGLGGLTAAHDRELFVYKEPLDAAELILRLHEDQSLRSRVAQDGRSYVEAAHGWNGIHESIRENVAGLFCLPVDSPRIA